MISQIIKLSVFSFLMIFSKTVNADSFFYINSTVCEEITKNQTHLETLSKAIDYASFSAVKQHITSLDKYKNIDDYVFNNISYQISDNLLRDVSVITTKETGKEICIELNAKLEVNTFNLTMEQHDFKNIDKEKVKNIANVTKTIYPEPKIPQIYIKDLEFYNNTKTNKYTQNISEQLYFNPNITVVTNMDNADYIIKPSLIKSSIDVIDNNNSKYSMSINIDVLDATKKIITSTQKNRYIIINNNDNKQLIADKLLKKLLKEAIDTLQKSSIIFNKSI